MAVIRKALVPGVRIYSLEDDKQTRHYALVVDGGFMREEDAAIFGDFGALSLAMTGHADWPWLRFYAADENAAKPVKGSQAGKRAARKAQPKPEARTATNLMTGQDYAVLAALRDRATGFLSPMRSQEEAPEGQTHYFCSACMAAFFSPVAPEGRGKAPATLRCPAGHDRSGYRADEERDAVLDTPLTRSEAAEAMPEAPAGESDAAKVRRAVRAIVAPEDNPAAAPRKPRTRRVKAEQPA